LDKRPDKRYIVISFDGSHFHICLQTLPTEVALRKTGFHRLDKDRVFGWRRKNFLEWFGGPDYVLFIFPDHDQHPRHDIGCGLGYGELDYADSHHQQDLPVPYPRVQAEEEEEKEETAGCRSSTSTEGSAAEETTYKSTTDSKSPKKTLI